MVKLCAIVPGKDDAQKIAMVHQLGLWGTAAGLDLHWDAEEARARAAPYHTAGVRLVQVGCYRNLIAVDETVRAAAIRDVCHAMELAGAMTVPAVICGGGHRHPSDRSDNAAVHPDTWTDYAIDVLVESCQEIVATVSPAASTLCLEPWVITSLDSPARLEQVVTRVDHLKLAVELDPVNMMTIERYADTGRFLTECFDRLGDKIHLVHAKDSLLKPQPFSYHMSEAVPGEGNLDYPTLLRLMQRLPSDTPLLVEHLSDEATIARACAYIRSVASQLSLSLD
ncbi:MAG: sugar phosphate isomerase/epimerase [Chloroflexi bacterium]|nr:sugar phosphate isomerase/epimerase [Chloroflexota bacterium]